MISGPVALLFGSAVLFATATPMSAADAAPLGPVVELPPMVIEERSPVPWLYTRVDDTEYLSRCSEATTRGYAEMRRSRMQWVRALFPEALLMRMDVPIVTVLVSQQKKSGNPAEVIGELVELNQRRAS